MTDLDDWLENAIMDSIDIDWTSRDAAKLIVSRMQAEGMVIAYAALSRYLEDHPNA